MVIAIATEPGNATFIFLSYSRWKWTMMEPESGHPWSTDRNCSSVNWGLNRGASSWWRCGCHWWWTRWQLWRWSLWWGKSPSMDSLDDDDNYKEVHDNKDKRESPRTVQTGVGPDQTPFLHFTRELPINWKPLSQRTCVTTLTSRYISTIVMMAPPAHWRSCQTFCQKCLHFESPEMNTSQSPVFLSGKKKKLVETGSFYE